MSSDYRFKLEPYSGPSSRYRCPSCGKNKVFTRYIDLGNYKSYVNANVGICDRIQKCNYHYPPSSYFKNEHLDIPTPTSRIPVEIINHEPSFIPESYVKNSHIGNEENNLLNFLRSIIPDEDVDLISRKYKIGTFKRWGNATIFWQIDNSMKVRTGKCILYNSNTGKKQRINWFHTLHNFSNFKLKQCLFGLHLLNLNPSKSIAVVESEKTAIIASIAFPEFIWMATGGLNNLNERILNPLKGRNVILFPDAGCYEIWKDKISSLPPEIHIQISDLLYRTTSMKQKKEGLDIADYIVDIWKTNKE